MLIADKPVHYKKWVVEDAFRTSANRFTFRALERERVAVSIRLIQSASDALTQSAAIPEIRIEYCQLDSYYELVPLNNRV